MATEILGFLIIVGILIVFIVRRDLWNGASNKADEVEEASVKMRLQMEHSANAIITQMDSRIHQLEGLVSAADERARTLEQQLANVRADQERARERAEREFAAMRAAQTPYYAPQEKMYPPEYASEAVDYRSSVPPRRSLRPIDGVRPVHRPSYVSRARQRRGAEEDDFAETLSASMYAAESAYGGAPRRERPPYYKRGRYGGERYSEPFETVSYPAEPYREEEQEETWETYLEQPRRMASDRRSANASRSTQAIPAEMVVEETPAVIVDSQLSPPRETYRYEALEEEEPAFSQEQLEELARTEAEIVVSSSVADVVDLPVQPETEGADAYGSETEDVHAFAEPELPAEEELSYESEERPEVETADTPEEETEDREAPKSLVSAESAPQAELAFAEPKVDEAPADEQEEPLEEPQDEAVHVLSAQEPAAVVAEALHTISQDEVEGEADMEATAEEEAPIQEEAASQEGEAEEEDVYGGGEVPDIAPKDARAPSLADRARELLQQGMAPDEVARATGMGRSALALLAQMTQGAGKAGAAD